MKPALLIVAVDAELRQRAFDILTEAGYRVDAVGDARAGRRRVERDRYAVLFHDDDSFSQGFEGGPPCVVLGPHLLEGQPPPILDEANRHVEPSE